ncbi:MAG: hypothetical protein ACYDEQ_15515, partial [Desulfocucumaceae bacterium]
GVMYFINIIEIAGDYEGFLEAVERVLRTENIEKKKRRLEIAAGHSWESRVSFIADKIEGLKVRRRETGDGRR